VLPSGTPVCNFCDSTISGEFSSFEERAAARVHRDAQTDARARIVLTQETGRGPEWRGELEQRLEAYRVRRGRVSPAPDGAQSQLPFSEPSEELRSPRGVAVAEATPTPAPTVEDDFSFTIAIGRYAPPSEKHDGRMLIDVSVPSVTEPEGAQTEKEEAAESYGLYPVASLDDRRLAALIDGICLLFAFGGFLTLFGSLGGQFTLSKLSAAVYATTLAIVYLQYFALFTVFGGTTPGMMFRGLQVASFSGVTPTPRQMLLRAAGYALSAGTFFMGFVWAWWDEDRLTWHDRVSRTYLTSPRTRAHAKLRSA
jgi:uncharacterized RDD family membrane protein YckC